MHNDPRERFKFRPGRRVIVANPWDLSLKKPGRVAGMRTIKVNGEIESEEYLITFDHRPAPIWVPGHLVSEFTLTAVDPAQQEKDNEQHQH